MRYALKFAYDGTRFDGYARQPEGMTVEGEVLRAALTLGMADRIQSASRTDRNVSAAGNVISIDTDFPPEGIIPALNSKLSGIYFHSIAMVPESFNPRHASQRWYRYFLQGDGVPPIASLQEASSLFVGEHDFRLFSKKDTGEENTILAIDSIEFTREGDFIHVDIKAQRFLWELVRRMLSAVIDIAEGRLKPEMAEEMLAGSAIRPGGLKPLPPEPLVLMDVFYDIDFAKSNSSKEPFGDLAGEARVRAEVMGLIAKALRTSE